jgi:hypothetical protein
MKMGMMIVSVQETFWIILFRVVIVCW